MVLWLGRGAQRAERSAVEAVRHGDDLVAARLAIEPGQLDRRFHCLGAAVAEETLAAPTRTLAERLPEPALLFRVPGIRHVDQSADLLADGGDDARRAVADQVAAPAGEEIEIAIVLGVPHAGALAAHERYGIARVITDDVLPEQVDGLLRCHVRCPGSV